MRRPYRGFSLVELLVVVLILCAMMAILLPSLGRSMLQAGSTVCMHNLRGIYQALETYRGDNQGWIPVRPAGAGGVPTDARTWFGTLSSRHLMDPALLRCPSDPVRQPRDRYGAPVGGTSYGLSDFIQSSPAGYLANLERRQPRRPMESLLLADVGPDATDGRLGLQPGQADAHRSSGQLPCNDNFDLGARRPVPPWLTDRHFGAVNMVMIGGFVRRVPTDRMMNATIEAFYSDCAVGDCPLCLALRVPHYSFAHAQTYWWTGPVPNP